jgi:biopolymer transport protein ExbB
MFRKCFTGLVLTTGLLLATQPALAWWNADWTTRTKVTLDTTDKGLNLSAAQTDVVVPLRLHSGNFDFALAKVDGSDLRVVAGDDKTPLPFTVERFDGVNELAVLWVRVPTLAPASAANTVYVYAGNDKAPSAAATPVFASGFAAVLHFSEADGPATDAAGGVPSSAAALRERNGLLGGSAQLDGTALAFAGNDKLKFAAGSPLTVALWVKPDPAAAGAMTLLSLGAEGANGAGATAGPGAAGPLTIALNPSNGAGQLEARVGDKSITGGSLPPSAWAHVALVVGAGKATLYVNGKPAGSADAALPALAGGMALGAGFKGLIDEVELLPGARDDGWVRLQAAAQGADNGFIKSAKESGDTPEAGGSTGYFGILFKSLTTDAWVVIGILGVMFMISVWVMVTKFSLVMGMARDNEAFLQRFRDEGGGEKPILGTFSRSSLFRLYSNGVAELDKRKRAGKTTLSGASFDAIKATLDADLVRENHALNDRIVLLTIAIAGGPFLGLLGTVVGVMITFAAIAAAGDVNVNAIAPGIAAALLATVAGLGVAIPSLFGYNYLAAKIRNISSDMQIFVDEFITRAAELHGE